MLDRPRRPVSSRRTRGRCAVGLALALAATLPASAAMADPANYRPPEYGYNYGEVEAARTLAMGGAARAWGWSTPAIASNPANVAAQHVYHFEALFGLDAKAHRVQYGGAVMDSITSRLAMGVLGVKSQQGTDDTYQRGGLDVRLAAAYPLSDKLSFGLTGRYLRVTQDGSGPLGAGPISRTTSDDPNFRAITFDAGLMIALNEAVRLGAVGYNLTSTGSPLAPLMVGGGIGVKIGDATVEGNVVGVDKSVWGAWKTRLQAGFEILVADRYPLRVGYVFDSGTKRHGVSGGLGYVDQQFAVDVGVRQEVAGPNDPWGKSTLFAIGLRYFYENAAPAEQPAQF